VVEPQMKIKIDLSGKQRMLTQKMTKEALLISLEIDKEKNKENLIKTRKLFDQTLIGLKEGDETLELTKTEHKDILLQLAKVEALWSTFKVNVTAETMDTKTLLELAENNLGLLSSMNKVVSMYADVSGADLNELANVINLAGKQRMLTQKMTKERLLIVSGLHKDENTKNIKETIALFDRTLEGLIKGDKDLALPATKDKAILVQLKEVQTLWAKFKPIISQEKVDKALLADIAEYNLPLLIAMDKAVKMYTVLSEH